MRPAIDGIDAARVVCAFLRAMAYAGRRQQLGLPATPTSRLVEIGHEDRPE